MQRHAEFGPTTVRGEPDAKIADEVVVFDCRNADLRPFAGFKAGVSGVLAQNLRRFGFRHRQPTLIARNVGIASIRVKGQKIRGAKFSQADAFADVRQVFEEVHR